jgi:DNA-binding NarL/FixJ family response regulator
MDTKSHAACGCECALLQGAVNDVRGFAKLTDRERQVLTLLGQGLANRLIARRLGIVERTAKAHVSSIVEKLGVSSRLEAGLMAHLHHELLCPRDIVPKDTSPTTNSSRTVPGC